jgi:two-component system sensor histidine kinase/response regulator
VIFLSAADEPDVVVAALGAGGVDYLTKPFHRAELALRVRTHVELKHARDRLEEALGKKDRLMDILAHDLKNPLSTIHMAAEMLATKGLVPPERAGKLADCILTASTDMLQFIQGFLARNAEEHTAGAMRISRVDLQPLLRRAVGQSRLPAQRKRIEIIVAAAPEPVVVRGDRGAISRILDNLLSNSIKFSSPGRRVWISLRAEDGSGVLEVRDEGQGFSAEDKEAMFQSYRRLSARPTGNEPSTGLGLSIVKRLADAMGAKIHCDSEAGKGARFTVSLPLSQDDASPVRASSNKLVP